MNNKIVLQKTLLAASIAVLSACGGSGGGTASTTGSSTVGVITGFGSIYMNGVEYETDSASVSVDGKQSVEGSLGVGDVCTLTSTVNADGITGTATAVSCADELEGYVLEVGLPDSNGTRIINIMGQTVTVTLDTVYEDDAGIAATIGDLVAGQIVEVHGFSDGLGTILATRIETKNAAEDVELKGLVSGLDEVALTFTIGTLIIDYSSANVEPVLADGLYVEVKTNSALVDNSPAAGYTMIASKVELEEDGDKEVHGDEGDEIEMQGMISDIDLTAGTFRFNGQLVEIASLETDDDFDPSSLAGLDGQMIKVEGYINAAGDFVIKEIEQEHASEDEHKGTVTAVTDTTVTVDDNGVLKTFTVNNDTRMMDEAGSAPVFYFSLSDVSIGDYVEVEYYMDTAGSNNAIAKELVREDMLSMSPPAS